MRKIEVREFEKVKEEVKEEEKKKKKEMKNIEEEKVWFKIKGNFIYEKGRKKRNF